MNEISQKKIGTAAFILKEYTSAPLQRMAERGGWILSSHLPARIKKIIASTTLVFFFTFTILPQAFASPVIENIQGDGTLNQEVEGNVTNITVAGNLTATTTNADQLASEIWNIHFANHSDSLILNVFDSTGTQLMGTINIHNGLFALLNSAGVEIAQSAAINLFDAGFIASALGSINANLDTGKYVFQSEDGQNGFVLNNGQITGTEGSFAAMLGRAVENAGQIEMPMGKVALAGGEQVTLSLTGNNDFISVVVDEAVTSPVLKNGLAVQNQIEVGGTLEAHQVMMDAQAVNDVFDNSVNITGHVKANTAVENQDGSIDIVASDDIRVRDEAMLEALEGTINLETESGMIVNDGVLRGGTLEMNAGGVISTMGTLEAALLSETAAEFNVGGIYHVGLSYHDNLDNAITYAANTSVSGTISDIANIVINAGVTITLAGNTVFNADSDANGSGAFTMASTAAIQGQGYDLTLRASDNSTVGIISNVGTLEIARNATDANIVFSSATTVDDIDVVTFYTNSSTATGVTFTKTVGSGTAGSPRLIYDTTQLQNVNGLTWYKMANNIDASSTSSWNSGAGFAPLGDYYRVFDGDNFAIINLTINRSGASGVGLIARLETGTVQNLGLINPNITGYDLTGGITGWNDYGTITNSFVLGGTITGNDSTGGLTGRQVAGSTSTSYSTATVSGHDRVGGLVGWLDQGPVSNSFSTGNVTGNQYVGGLIGRSVSGSGITNTYATGAVAGSDGIGGLIGWDDFSPVSYSYSSGTVTGSTNTGGFFGRYSGGARTSNYWNTETSGQATSAGSGAGLVEGKTSAQMKQQATFSGWTFGDGNGAWIAFEGEYAPHLDYEWSSSIATLLQLQNMNLNLDGDYILANDIDASATRFWNWDGANYLGFDPVGGTGFGNEFKGSLDGQNFVISNLTINRPTESGVGLFGYILDSSDTATISNVNLGNVDITGQGFIGGLVGVNGSIAVGGHAATISNSSVTGVISGAGDYVGGLVGYNSGAISRSYTDVLVSVSGTPTGAGGFAGYNESTISDSYALGNVSGYESVGGFVGENRGLITTSYAAGDVTSTGFYVGGFAGYSDSEINSSFATGDVIGNSGDADVGGFVGFETVNADTLNDYYSGSVTNNGGGGTNGSGNYIADPADFYDLNHAVYVDGTSWDFDDIWDSFNNALPHLQWENAGITVSGTATGAMDGEMIGFAINGVSGLATAVLGEAFSFNFYGVNADDTLLLYADDSGNGYSSNLVTVLDGTDLAGLGMANGAITLRHDNSGSLTNADLAAAWYNDDNVNYTVSGDDAAFSNGMYLWIAVAHTYAPGGNVEIDGSWENDGTFTHGNNTVTFNGAFDQSINSNGSSFYNVAFESAGTVTLNNNLIAEGNIVIAFGGTFDASGGDVTVGGDWTNNGTFAHGNNIVTFNGSGAQSINTGGSSFYGIYFDNSSGTISVADGDTLTIEGYVSLSRDTEISSVSDSNMVVAGDIDGPFALTVDMGTNGSIDFQGAVGIGTALASLNLIAGEIAVTSVFTEDAQTYTASGNIGVTSLTSNNDSVTLTADSDGDGSGSVTATNSISAVGNVELSAGEDVNVQDVTSAGAVTMTADTDGDGAGNITAGLRVQAAEAVQMSAGGNIEAFEIMSDSNNITLNADVDGNGVGGVTATGVVQAGGAVEMNAAQDINVVDVTSDTDAITLNADVDGDGAGSVTATGTLQASGAVEINAAQDINVVDVTSTAGGITLNADVDGDGMGSVTAGFGILQAAGAVEINAAQDINVVDVISDTDGIILNADVDGDGMGSVTAELGTLQAAGNVSLDAGEDITFHNMIVGGNILIGANREPTNIIQGNGSLLTLLTDGAYADFRSQGAIGEENAPINIEFNGNANSYITAQSSGTGDIYLAEGSDTALNVGAITTADGSISLTGDAITLMADLTTNSAGSVASILLTGPVTLANDIIITTTGNAGDDITFTSTLDGAHNLTLDAGLDGNVNMQGEIGTNQILGNLSVTAETTTISSDLNIGGNFENNGGETDFSGDGVAIWIGSHFNLNAGAVSAGNTEISVGGNWNDTQGSFDAGTGLVTLVGGGTVTTSDAAFNHLNISASAIYSSTGEINVGGDLTITSGDLDLDGNNMIIGGDLTLGGGGLTGSLAALLDVEGDFSMLSGTFVSPGIMTVAGDFLVSGGTFNHNNGDVILDGNTNVTVDAAGTINFWDFTITSLLAKTVSFTAGDTFNVLSPNTFTVTGADNLNPITLQSTVTGDPGQRWNLGLEADGWDLTNVILKDSNNTNFATAGMIDAGGITLNLVDGGNNSNSFTVIPPPQTCQESGTCLPEPTCEELGTCPQEQTCEELGTCPPVTIDPLSENETDQLIEIDLGSLNEKGDGDCDDVGEALTNPACKEGAKAKVTVYEGSVYLYCADGKEICGVMEAGGRVEIEGLAPPSEMQTILPEEKELGQKLYDEMRRKVGETAAAGIDIPEIKPQVEMSHQQRFATLTKFQGEVLIKKAGSDMWVPAEAGMVFGEKDEIKTGKGAKVEVHLDQDAETGKFYLYENSLIRLATLERDGVSQTKNTVLDLAMGRVITRAEKLQGESKFNIRTPTVVAGVRGTLFEISVDRAVNPSSEPTA